LLQVNVEENYSAILAEQFAQATETYALGQALNILGAQNGDGSAFIIDLDSVKVDSDTGVSLATRFSTIDSSISTNAASITTEQTTRADADTAIASTIALMGAENGAGTAFILDEDTVKIASDGGDTVAERFTALSAADSANSASITTIQTVDLPDLTARYGVSLNANGYVSGFLQNNDGTSGSFVIAADKFAVVTPQQNWWSEYSGFYLGETVRSIPNTSGKVWELTTTGTTGASQPTWNENIGQTTADGSCVWTCRADTAKIPFLLNGDKIVMNADVAIDGDLLVTGTINGNRMINGTIGSTQIGANAITTTQLNANAVTSAKIQANAVTATEINVTSLSSMTTETGTLTVGSSGHIKGGQTAYDTGSGFFLGYSSGYKFSIGNGSTQSLTWDGTTLTVQGDLIVGAYVATNDVMLSALTARSSTTEAWVTKKSFTIDRPGTVRVAADYKREVPTDLQTHAQARILLNSTTKTTFNVTWNTYTEQTYDVSGVTAGDQIHIQVYAGTHKDTPPLINPFAVYVDDAEIRGDVNFSTGGTVDLD
jgi:hypothetical protein